MRLGRSFAIASFATVITAAAMAVIAPGPAAAENVSAARGVPPCGHVLFDVTSTPVARPVNHVLLTLTNTGTEPCAAYGAPVLRFPGSHTPADVWADSRPGSVIVVRPGESAFSGLTASAADGSGADGRRADRGFLRLQGEHGELVGPLARVELRPDVWVDSKATVTHWQATAENALAW
ncbi:DUF4232 domain-containing protein [Streptomyces lavendulae]|uniref:DUF4232 domain-containing protein n=1 Tax=Streptomyces lavendulae TaxID=1914 RepID=UPI00382422EB